MASIWRVEYSLYLDVKGQSFPSVPRRQVRSFLPRIRSMWMKSSETVYLRISNHPTTGSSSVLCVYSPDGEIHQTCRLCDLYITWMWLDSPSLCPIKGTRTLYISYYVDSPTQVNMFAIRFSTPEDLTAFLAAIQDFSKILIALGQSKIANGASVISEILFPRGFDEKNITFLAFKDEEKLGFFLPTVVNDIQLGSSSLPPSYTPVLGVNETVDQNSLTSEGSISFSEILEVLEQPIPEVTNSGGTITSVVESYLSGDDLLDMVAGMEQLVNDFGGLPL